MTDQEFLWWIHQRLVYAHGERELSDYMHHLRAIIVDMPAHNKTPNVARMDTDPDVMDKRFGRNV